MSFRKKVIFENFVTYEVLHGQRRLVVPKRQQKNKFIVSTSVSDRLHKMYSDIGRRTSAKFWGKTLLPDNFMYEQEIL